MIPSKFIGIRLPEDILTRLEKIAQRENQTPNQLAKIAILEWTESYWTRNSEVITVTRSSYSKLIEMLEEDQLHSFVSDIAASIIEYYEYSIQKNAGFSNLDEFLTTMSKFIGDKTGLQWFRQMDYEAKKLPFFFKGNHDMGKKWSQIFIYIFEQILTMRTFNFKIVSKKTICSERMVYLEFQKKKNID
jgi:hypothetical protein